MRDFPDFVEIYPICQPLAVLPDISLILLSIGSYLELAIFREDFSSVASVNVRFSWVFYFVFICCCKLNSPHNEMRTGPGLFLLGAFPTFRSHDFRHECLSVESSEGGRAGLKWFITRRRLKIFENFLLCFKNKLLCNCYVTQSQLLRSRSHEILLFFMFILRSLFYTNRE